MPNDSPAVILYDGSGNPLAVQNGSAIPANTSALLVAGSDGTNSRYMKVDSSGQLAISAASLPLPTGAATETTLGGVLTTTAFQARINTQGQKAMAASTPVVVASDQSAIPVTPARSSTATLSNVAADTSSQTLLAANASRLGAIIVNDSSAKLYVKFGTTASDTSFTAKLFSGDTYEIPFGYSGRIDGIWSVANGYARITELT